MRAKGVNQIEDAMKAERRPWRGRPLERELLRERAIREAQPKLTLQHISIGSGDRDIFWVTGQEVRVPARFEQPPAT
jgi:hypothetical protein